MSQLNNNDYTIYDEDGDGYFPIIEGNDQDFSINILELSKSSKKTEFLQFLEQAKLNYNDRVNGGITGCQSDIFTFIDGTFMERDADILYIHNRKGSIRIYITLIVDEKLLLLFERLKFRLSTYVIA